MDFSEKEEVDDILPDTNVDREKTLTGKWALAVLVWSQGCCHSVFNDEFLEWNLFWTVLYLQG